MISYKLSNRVIYIKEWVELFPYTFPNGTYILHKNVQSVIISIKNKFYTFELRPSSLEDKAIDEAQK